MPSLLSLSLSIERARMRRYIFQYYRTSLRTRMSFVEFACLPTRVSPRSIRSAERPLSLYARRRVATRIARKLVSRLVRPFGRSRAYISRIREIRSRSEPPPFRSSLSPDVAAWGHARVSSARTWRCVNARRHLVISLLAIVARNDTSPPSAGR